MKDEVWKEIKALDLCKKKVHNMNATNCRPINGMDYNKTVRKIYYGYLIYVITLATLLTVYYFLWK